MSTHTQTPAACCDFEGQHALHGHPAMHALERRVLGCDYGGTSWTTRDQADRLAAALKLEAGGTLLDIGSGNGWPAVYVATRTRCTATLLDIPFRPLQLAAQRARQENVSRRCRAVVASAAALPFPAGRFDALSHSDVLCCLPQKSATLRECRRVARTGARMVFFVIAPAARLEPAEHAEACEVGPPFVALDDDYPAMLAATGWEVVSTTDLTAEYLATLSAFSEGLAAGADDFIPVMGRADYEAQVAHRRAQVSAIGRGLLVRTMFQAKAA